MTSSDKLLVVAVLAAAVLAAAQLWFRPATAAGQAVISVEGRAIQSVALLAGAGRTTISVAGRLGPATVEVAGERIRMLDAPCPNHLCMHQGWITRPGASIVCLPGEIVIRIEGADRVDAVTR